VLVHASQRHDCVSTAEIEQRFGVRVSDELRLTARRRGARLEMSDNAPKRNVAKATAADVAVIY
jgi:hypothetical protein